MAGAAGVFRNHLRVAALKRDDFRRDTGHRRDRRVEFRFTRGQTRHLVGGALVTRDREELAAFHAQCGLQRVVVGLGLSRVLQCAFGVHLKGSSKSKGAHDPQETARAMDAFDGTRR